MEYCLCTNKQEFFTVIEGRVRLHHKHSDIVIEVSAGEAELSLQRLKGHLK